MVKKIVSYFPIIGSIMGIALLLTAMAAGRSLNGDDSPAPSISMSWSQLMGCLGDAQTMSDAKLERTTREVAAEKWHREAANVNPANVIDLSSAARDFGFTWADAGVSRDTVDQATKSYLSQFPRRPIRRQ